MANKLNAFLSFLLLQGNISSDSGRQVNTNWFKMLGQFFFLIIVFIFVLIAAYYVTKWMGKLQYQRYQGNNIKIIESVIIAPQKTLQLIEVGNKIHLIGLSKDNIIYLAEVEKDTIKNFEADIKDPSYIKFESYLKPWMDKLKKDSKSKDITSSGEIRDENK